MKRPSRRTVLGLLGAGGATLVGGRLALPFFLRPGPVRGVGELSPEAQALVARAFADVNPTLLWDSHAHLVGLGVGGTGAAIHPDMRSHLHPWRRFQFDMYLAASGVSDLERADEAFLERLLALHRAANPRGKLLLLAFDWYVDEAGEEVPEASTFHMPNERVLAIAARHADVEACASVHPYRTDALARLDAAAAAGAKAVKWLPNAMGIDPAAQRCDAFYKKLVELGLVLITHAGLEKAVHAEEDQELGNPLRLRRALDHGVRVVVAHCASTGTGVDLDAGSGEADCFDLFLRLMGEKQYERNLFGDVSAMTQVNRSGRPLREVIRATELHARLINGSDYPLPAIDPLVSTRWLKHKGYLTAEERGLCNEIFEANALLFDYVVKRCLRVDGKGFAPVVFESGRLFG